MIDIYIREISLLKKEEKRKSVFFYSLKTYQNLDLLLYVQVPSALAFQDAMKY